MKVNSSNKGFTLIELIMVIVILGILAAIAIPKFVDLRSDAQTGNLNGIAGALSAASSVNYAGCSAVNNVVTANKCVKVSKCSDATTLLTTPSITVTTTATPALNAYGVTADTAVATNGTTASCTLNFTYATGTTVSANYTVIGAGN